MPEPIPHLLLTPCSPFCFEYLTRKSFVWKSLHRFRLSPGKKRIYRGFHLHSQNAGAHPFPSFGKGWE